MIGPWGNEAGRAGQRTTPARGEGEVLLGEDVLAETRRIVFATPVVLGLAWRPGYSIEVEVAPRTWRRYLLSWTDRFTGRAEVIAALGAGGPGAWWAATADTGDPLRLRGVRDEGLLEPRASRHLVLGDETAVGLHAALVRWLPATHALDAVIEVAPWTRDVTDDRVSPPFTVVPREVGEPGASLALDARSALAGDTAVYLVGSASLIARVAPSVRGRVATLRTLETGR